MEDKISFVILCYNGYLYTHQLLMDIFNKAKDVHEVIVVDNASEDVEVKNGLDYWIRTNMLPLTVYHLKDNLGFIGGSNYGLSKACGDINCLFSNDVRIGRQDLIPQIRTEVDDKTLLGGVVYTYDTGWNNFNGQIQPYAEGWFLGAKKEFWERTNGFDPIYAPSDFEDVDLSRQALKMGYTLKQFTPNTLEHLGGKTYGYNDTRLSRTRANQDKYAQKWGLGSYAL